MQSLESEADYLFSSLFKIPFPARAKERFVQAHTFLPPEIVREGSQFMAIILQYRLDVEALEFALRKKNPILTRKFKILFPILEAEPEFYPVFHNSVDQPLRGWIALGASAIRGFFKLLKGRYLIWKYDLH